MASRAYSISRSSAVALSVRARAAAKSSTTRLSANISWRSSIRSGSSSFIGLGLLAMSAAPWRATPCGQCALRLCSARKLQAGDVA